ncbi:hypothetical protein M431DRAFT_486348 [Trichoderma harzianum CBS 226.95]|uniref:Uncharacterized protein n=1 Tax=Trichoderma harzianum CBS 226.95 TaxID=983964 RepID=A0A2T3ZYB1_TRIHA|nr:hypothetical protein M431DRAFT_486348 [Trichoderma harzianum CBS 226.95]PTB49800.1 hypothetical protein M431DRAFT_486348 [Trichoderma harzianum CBS 226.95]
MRTSSMPAILPSSAWNICGVHQLSTSSKGGLNERLKNSADCHFGILTQVVNGASVTQNNRSHHYKRRNDICRQRRNDTCDGNQNQLLQMERFSSVISIKRVDARVGWQRPGHDGQLKINAIDQRMEVLEGYFA